MYCTTGNRENLLKTTYSSIHWQAVHHASNLLLQYKSDRNNFLSDEMNYLDMVK